MTGIKLTIDESGEADIFTPEEPGKPKCLINNCDYILPEWECGYDATPIWEHYRNPGWCPAFKWYRTSKVKEFNREQREANRRKYIKRDGGQGFAEL